MKIHIEVDPHDADDVKAAAEFLMGLGNGEQDEAPKKTDQPGITFIRMMQRAHEAWSGSQ